MSELKFSERHAHVLSTRDGKYLVPKFTVEFPGISSCARLKGLPSNLQIYSSSDRGRESSETTTRSLIDDITILPLPYHPITRLKPRLWLRVRATCKTLRNEDPNPNRFKPVTTGFGS